MINYIKLVLSTLLLFATGSCRLNAQWIQTNGPYGGSICMSFAVIPNDSGQTNIYVGTYGSGVFRSTNNGKSWSDASNGITNKYIWTLGVCPNGKGGVNLLAAANVDDFYLSKGQLDFSGNTYCSVYISTNMGQSWAPITNGLTDNAVRSFALIPEGFGRADLFAAGGGILRSTDCGVSWENIGLKYGIFNSLVYTSDKNGRICYFAGGRDGVFLSTDNGINWTHSALTNGIRSLVLVPDGNGKEGLFAATSLGGVHNSTDHGKSWSNVDTTFTERVEFLTYSSDGNGNMNLFAGTWKGVFISTNRGRSWSATGLKSLTQTLAALQDKTGGLNLFAGTYASGVFLSTDKGKSWSHASNGLPYSTVNSFAQVPGENGRVEIFAGTEGGLFHSTDYGDNWNIINAGLTGDNFYDLSVIPNEDGSTSLFAGTNGSGVIVSTDKGASWMRSDSGLDGRTVRSLAVGLNSTGGKSLFAAAEKAIYISTDKGASWSKTNSLPQIIEILAFTGKSEAEGQTILACNGNMFWNSYYGGIILSDDNGKNWRDISKQLPEKTAVWTIASIGSDLFAGTSKGVFLSTDRGQEWKCISKEFSAANVRTFAVAGTNLFAGTDKGLFLSKNKGINWTKINIGPIDPHIKSLAIIGDYLFAGIEDCGAWRCPLSEMIH